MFPRALLNGGGEHMTNLDSVGIGQPQTKMDREGCFRDTANGESSHATVHSGLPTPFK